MKQILLIIGLLVQTTWLFAQNETRDIHKANKLYEQGKYKEAELNYRKSLEKSSSSLKGNFNLGDALFKQKKFDEASSQFEKIVLSTKNKEDAAIAYHNMGNSLLAAKKLQESVNAYKKALLNNPKDDQTRYNLAYAQQMLKKQQEQQKKDQDKKDKDKKDGKKDPNKKDPNNKDQDKKDQEKKDQDKKDQEKKDQDKKNQQAQPQPDKLSKQDAERMLQALDNEERNTQEKLKKKKLKGAKVQITKDW